MVSICGAMGRANLTTLRGDSAAWGQCRRGTVPLRDTCPALTVRSHGEVCQSFFGRVPFPSPQIRETESAEPRALPPMCGGKAHIHPLCPEAVDVRGCCAHSEAGSSGAGPGTLGQGWEEGPGESWAGPGVGPETLVSHGEGPGSNAVLQLQSEV